MQSCVVVRRTGTLSYTAIDAIVPLPVPVKYNAAAIDLCSIYDCSWSNNSKDTRITAGAAYYRADIVRKSAGGVNEGFDPRYVIGGNGYDEGTISKQWACRFVTILSEVPVVKGYVVVRTEAALSSASYLMESVIRISYRPLVLNDREVLRLMLDEASDVSLGLS